MKLLFLLLIPLAACNTLVENDTSTLVNELWPREEKSYNNYRIPSLIVTRKNTLLAFCEGREAGDTGDIDILLKRSSDSGKTWEEQIVVWDDSVNTCGNPCPVIEQNTGRIIVFMTWNLGTDLERDIIRKRSLSTRIPYMTYSDDDGLTWSEPENLAKTCKNEEWGWYATGPGFGIQMKSEKYRDRLVIPCNNSYDDPENIERDGFGYGSHVLLSDDGGVSWRMSEIITPNVNESQVVEIGGGVLLMNMRSYNRKSSRSISLSHDGGETWSEVAQDPQLVESVCQGSIMHYGTFNGKDMYLFSNPSVPFGRSHMTIKTSFDECRTWTNSKLIWSGPSAYSCLTKLPNGDVGLFFESGEKNPYEKMVFVSLKADELFFPGSPSFSSIKSKKWFL